MPRGKGFALLDKETLRELSRKGGKASHAAGVAHEFTPDEAREAGKKGGAALARRRRERRKEISP